MAESHIKKSTIMFTDIFGYSRMVGRDEKHALKLLDEHNNIITAAIDAHDGSVIKFIGDAEERIKEDYLRILRYFRFFIQYSKFNHEEKGLYYIIIYHINRYK